MGESILTSVKKGVGGIVESDTWFDDTIIMHINTVLSKLTQLGVGPRTGFQIEDKTATWDQFVDDVKMNMVKTYVVLNVQLLFDPPTVGGVINSITEQIRELEWRLNEQAEYDKAVENQNGNS